MKREVGPVLMVLAILLDPRSLAQETTAPPQGVPVFCDDPSVLKAAVSAVNTFNRRLSAGPQLALFQVLSASKDGSVYTLSFSIKRSQCPVGGSRDWTECDVLSTGPQEPLMCNGTVTMTDTETETGHVDCQLDPILSEKAPCLGCPTEISEDSEDLKVPLSVSVLKFNSESSASHLFSLHQVGPATRQVIAGFRFTVTFDMRRTTCSKSEHKELSELCIHDDENKEYVYCNSTVDLAPWRLEPEQVQIDCESGPLPPMTRIKRRPPGWSPLRTAVGSTLAPPTSAPAHQESSEEDTTGTQAPAVDQHHCPSSPWKPLTPAPQGEAVQPTTHPGTAAPSVDGTFSDADLLG